jgi:hypothetical protein
MISMPSGIGEFNGRGSRSILTGVAFAALTILGSLLPAQAADPAPRPVLTQGGQPVDWWFVFKFNSIKTFAGCGREEGVRACIFGGKVHTKGAFGQQFAVASNNNPALHSGEGCLGATLTDPVGATFEQVHNGHYFYVLWNDQFYGDPKVCGNSANCTGRWGHSKGMLAWNEEGEGFVMQVTTPSWPGSGSQRIKRKSGNTLGCVSTNNNLKASQHFFALKLNKRDLIVVLDALKVASVATSPVNLQVVHNGGPSEVRGLVQQLGQKLPKTDEKVPIFRKQLSTGVTLIAKPSDLNVPPWQMVSALLGGAPERAATWWTKPWIYSTTKSTHIQCWDEPAIGGKSGPVAIALTGEWDDKEIKLNAPSNHAKIGVASSGNDRYVIFGDLNQQGSVRGRCNASQNGRGGLFFVVKNDKLHESVSALIAGNTAKSEPRR